MFNREFRTAEHRQHMRPPTSPGYTFEAVGTPGRTASRIDTLRSIVQNGQHEEVDGMVVDLQTANLLVQIYDKGNDNTKNLVETAPLEKVVGAAWKLTSGSKLADRWVLDDIADMAGMTAPLGNGWEVLHTNGGGSVLFREFSDYDSGSVAPPAVPGDPWKWYVNAQLYQVQVGSGSANTAEEAMRMVEETYAAYKTASRKQGSRRTAFLDSMELPETRHRVAGWDWDDHLNGFIAAEAAREFTCACGENIPAPGYTDCRCGKRWNAYTIQANGSKKMVAREVPVRQNVVMARTARRKTAVGWSKGTHPDISGLSDEQLQDFIDNVQESIDAGANVGEIMKNKRDRFEEELRSRGRKATRKQAASSPSEVISQHFSGWQVDDDDGDFWEIQSPGREHAFIHEGGDVYTVLINDQTSREVWETGLTFDEALEEFRAEGVI